MPSLHTNIKAHSRCQPLGTTMFNILPDASNTDPVLLDSLNRHPCCIFIFSVISSMILYCADLRQHVDIVHGGSIVQFVSKLLYECYPGSKHFSTTCSDADILNKGYGDLYDKILERINLEFPVNVCYTLHAYSNMDIEPTTIIPRFKIFWTVAAVDKKFFLQTHGADNNIIQVFDQPYAPDQLWRHWFNSSQEFDILLINIHPMEFLVKRVMPTDILMSILSSKTSAMRGNPQLDDFKEGMRAVDANQLLQSSILDHYRSIMTSGMQQDSLKAFKKSLGKENWGLLGNSGPGRPPHSMVWIMESFISNQIRGLTFTEFTTRAAARQAEANKKELFSGNSDVLDNNMLSVTDVAALMQSDVMPMGFEDIEVPGDFEDIGGLLGTG
jgi:hypothetical protein